MLLEAKDTKIIGRIAKVVRQQQELDQTTAGSFAGCGINFVSQFENGKPTVQLEKALNMLSALGIKVYLDVPDSSCNQKLQELTGNE
ncbi:MULTISPECIES: transcriptional regulator [unclassified Idiomarina]|jgi:transcriptional regulator with XRE-family HTH domain|uniref:transcriptional regulator n=1 Tax=unclassified Idiomarina TaxID=2614829 RepID=UPI00257D8BE4|nr:MULTISPECIES: transcriptional regulator [unclassified Idiomarina]|tara:strand:+ start:2978 stop:3238 length:261 start_codon:yes stop_codon:yes gene_type:complete